MCWVPIRWVPAVSLEPSTSVTAQSKGLSCQESCQGLKVDASAWGDAAGWQLCSLGEGWCWGCPGGRLTGGWRSPNTSLSPKEQRRAGAHPLRLWLVRASAAPPTPEL